MTRTVVYDAMRSSGRQVGPRGLQGGHIRNLTREPGRVQHSKSLGEGNRVLEHEHLLLRRSRKMFGSWSQMGSGIMAEVRDCFFPAATKLVETDATTTRFFHNVVAELQGPTSITSLVYVIPTNVPKLSAFSLLSCRRNRP